MNVSILLSTFAGLFGLFALIHYFCILKPNVNTNIYNVLPIIIGSLAWLSAGVTFYQTETYNSPVDFERLCMVITWVMLIMRLKAYRQATIKDKV